MFLRSEGLPADGAHKACWVVGLPQHCHHLPLHKLPTVAAHCAVQPLEVQRAQEVAIFHEEAALNQVTATYWIKQNKTS